MSVSYTALVQAAIVACALSTLVGGQAARPPASGPNQEWRDWAGSPEGHRYVALDEITKENVSKLQVAWIYPYAQTTVNPIVAHGVVYTIARNKSIVALDAATGHEIWIHDGLTGMTERGINYWESADGSDRRIIFNLNDYVQELDARRGKIIRNFGVNGVVDRREGIGRDQRFWRLAQALSALYPAHSDEKRWVDGVLARKKGLGF